MADPQSVVWDDEQKAAPAAAPSSANVQWDDNKPASAATPAQGSADVPQSIWNLRRMGQTALQTITHPIRALDTASQYYGSSGADTKDESIGHGVVKSLGRTATMIPSLIAHPYDALAGGNIALKDRADKEASEGRTAESMLHSVAAGVPLFGPMAVSIGERLGGTPTQAPTKSDIAGGITDIATLAALPKITEAVKEGVAPSGVLRRSVTSPRTPAPEGAPALPTVAAGVRTAARSGAPIIEAVTDPLSTLKKGGKYVADKVATNFKDYGLTPDQQRAEYLTKSAKGVEGLQKNVDSLQAKVDIAKKTSSGYVPQELTDALEKATGDLHDKMVERARINPRNNEAVANNPQKTVMYDRDGNEFPVQRGATPDTPLRGEQQSLPLEPQRSISGPLFDKTQTDSPNPGRVEELDQLAEKARTASPEELEETDRMGDAKHNQVLENLRRAAKASAAAKSQPESVLPDMGNTAEPQATAATPNIAKSAPEWTTPETAEIASGIKRVGRVGESKAAKIIGEQTGEGHVSQGQFAKANGPRIDAAVPNTPEGQTLANHIHSITNRELGQIAERMKVDIGGQPVGRNGITRSEVFNRILDAGKTPDDIVNSHYDKLGNPPSVSGGAPDIGTSTAKVWRDAPGETHPVKIVYDEYGQPTAETDGRHRVIQALKNGYDRIEVVVDRGNGPVKTTVPVRALARQMGVDETSLANTDSQQSYRAGNLKPRVAVTTPKR